MIRNYLKIAFRNLAKYKFISFINLFGLTVGLTCCLLILAYITHEVSYDKLHPHAERTYRFSRSFHNEEGISSLHLGAIAPPFGPYLKNEFPQIEKMTRLLPGGTTAFSYDDKKFYETQVFFADEFIGDVFHLDVLKGDVKKALSEPFSIMITENIAKKYFGQEDPTNKIIKLDNNLPCKVAGVYQSFPSNTHLHPEVLIAFNTLKDDRVYGENNLQTNWGNNSFLTYVVLAKGTDYKNFEKAFPAFLDKYYHFPEEPPGFKGSKFTHLYLTPVTDIHLYSHLDYEVEENGDIKRIYVFSIVGLFILLIACINYMNLSTARSVLRAKEIGIRKTVGAEKKEIVLQFLSESVLISTLALLLSIGFTALLLPWLNSVSGQDLSMNILMKWPIVLSIILSPFVIGIISGVYPAFFMSSFQPVKVLKGLFKVNGNMSMRKALVVAQFTVSTILIISTAIVFKQLRYMQQKSLGYDKNHIINIRNNTAFGNNFESFRNELLRYPGVKEVTRSSRLPSTRLLDALDVALPGSDANKPMNIDLKYLSVDYNFVPAYGLKVVAGRNFSTIFPGDSTSFVINESGTETLGWNTPQEAIGKELVYGGQKGKIIGVVNDFHFESLHQRIRPMIFIVNPNQYGNISVKLAGTNISAALEMVEKTWKKYVPETPYDYNFLDERFAQVYESEIKQKKLFTAFSCIAIFIACLGLFGLSAFTIGQRMKEIGIRKVLGANVNTIVALLSKDFLKLIVVAAIIAFPVGWLIMHKWLEGFAYRIDIPWAVFFIAGILATAVAFITIGIQAVKAATSNPIKNLRTE